jgi:PTS system ascorbate-specific IIA component
MIGILLIAHAPLASALAQSAQHVYSCAPERAESRLKVLDIEANADVAQAVARGRDLIVEIDQGDGVIVLTDAFGATPGNIATQLNQPGKVAVVAGVNLPMLLRTLCYRDGDLAATVEKALAGGTQGVMQVANTAVQNQGFKPQGNDLARIHHQQ